MSINPYKNLFAVALSAVCLGSFVLPGVGARPAPENPYQSLSNSILRIWPDSTDSIPLGICEEIKISINEAIPGRIKVNDALTADPDRAPRLIRIKEAIDSISAGLDSEEEFGVSVPEDAEATSDTLILYPESVRSGRTVSFHIDRQLPPGNWRLELPQGFLEVQPDFIEVDEMPFTQEEMLTLSPVGAWRKKGGEWTGRAMFSIHDDDGVDGKIPSCGTTHIPDRNGYFTILYPLLKSLGVRGNVSMEGWRCGMTADPPALNENGRIMYRLEKEEGWEMQAHSMEVLGDRNNNWLVDSLESELAAKILAEATGKGQANATTSVYDAKTRKQYYPSDDRTRWIEADSLKIKPYALDYYTRLPKLYIKEHSVAYHWGEWFRLAKEWGFRATAWVQHNAITSHDYAKEINSYGPYGFSDMVPPYQYNTVPMRSTATRLLVEGQSAPGYIGEMSDDNTFDHTQYKWFCDYIDRCRAENGWIVLGLHAYRKCWKNYLPGSLVSEGGDYPDEWVNPLEGMDFLNDPLDTPPARLGISSWSEWYPCPGTRLDMLRNIILYCLINGVENVTSSEGFERIGNRHAAGYFNNGVRCGYDRYILEDDREVYPHYIESATGEESYYRPLISDAVSHGFSIVEPDVTTGITSAIYRGPERYFDLWGNPVDKRQLGKGVYIKLGADGPVKIVQ